WPPQAVSSARYSFIWVDRLRDFLDDLKVFEHREDVRDRIDVDDLVALELEPGEPQHIQLVAGRLNTHIGAPGVLAVMVTQHADLIVAPAPGLQSAIDRRR